MEYYSGICRNCGEDCDDEFCSWECKQDWMEGYGDFLYEQMKDRELMEETL